MPPQSESSSVRVQSISKPSRTRAGRVKATPAAIDSPAEPVVCTTVFSRIEARPPRQLREGAEDRDGEDGDRHRRGDGQPDAQGQVDGGGAEDEAEERAQDDARGRSARGGCASSGT